ncbi:hypothetical protein Tco_1520773 [Tanacetum coccineum]
MLHGIVKIVFSTAPWNQPSFLWSRSPPRQKHYGTLLPAPLRVLYVDTSSSSKPSSSHSQKDLSLPLPLPPLRGSLTLAHPITSLKISPTSLCTQPYDATEEIVIVDAPARSVIGVGLFATRTAPPTTPIPTAPNKKMKKKIKVTPKKKKAEQKRCSLELLSSVLVESGTKEGAVLNFLQALLFNTT